MNEANHVTQEILATAQNIANEDQKKMAFENSFQTAIKYPFKTFTGYDYDSSLVNMYSKDVQEFLKLTKKLYRIQYDRAQKQEHKKITPDQHAQHIKIIDYSEKSIALIGDTKTIKDKFIVEGKKIGKFNRYLTVNGIKQAGWIFKKEHKNAITEIVNLNTRTHNPFENDHEEINTDNEDFSTFF